MSERKEKKSRIRKRRRRIRKKRARKSRNGRTELGDVELGERFGEHALLLHESEDLAAFAELHDHANVGGRFLRNMS